MRPIGVYYEHPRWFEPVFAEMDRRGVAYKRLDASRHHFDVHPNGAQQFGLIFNRMSPSAYTRGNGARNFLHAQLPRASRTHGHARRQRQRRLSQRDFESAAAFAARIARPPYPRSVVINHPSQAPDAARGLRFPIVVKPNIGGSGAGIVRFDSPEQFERAVREQ